MDLVATNTGLAAVWQKPSQTRDLTCVPRIGRWIFSTTAQGCPVSILSLRLRIIFSTITLNYFSDRLPVS